MHPDSAIAEVLLPLALDGPYSYRVPDGLSLAAGDYVAVPLGPRQMIGVVWRLTAEAGTDKTRILSAQIWLADMATFPEMNSVWDTWVPQGHTPARATGEAKLATPDYKVEVIVTAALR